VGKSFRPLTPGRIGGSDEPGPAASDPCCNIVLTASFQPPPETEFMPEPNTLWIIAAAVLFIGLVGALAGHRPLAASGRRCRRCGYDLSGSPETTHRCPECGVGLAGNVVLGGNSESDIRWRRRCRRGGYAIGTLAVAIGLLTAAIDSRRVLYMPTWWLVNIEAPLAARSNGDGVGWTEAVYATLSHRLGACNGTGDIDTIRSVAEPILARIDGTNHGGRWGRTFLLFAWDEGALTDEELASIDLLWPEPEIVAGPGCSVDGLDLLQSWELPFGPAPFTGRLNMRSLGGLVRVGTRSVPMPMSWTTNWPRSTTANRGSMVALISPFDGSFELDPGEHRVHVAQRFELIADGNRVLDARDIEFDGVVTIPEPPPLPRLSNDPKLFAQVIDRLQSSSWATREGDGLYIIHLAVPPGTLLTLGTPAMRVKDQRFPNNSSIWPPAPHRIESSNVDLTNARRSKVRRPIGSKETVRLLPGMPLSCFLIGHKGEPVPDVLTIRVDARDLDPRYWRNLVRENPTLTAPTEVPTGTIEFDIPVIEATSSETSHP
jgi:hypothetical protein